MTSLKRISDALEFRTGIWGLVVGIVTIAWKILSGVSNMDFVSANWSLIKTFLDGWGALVGFLIGGGLIAKALYDTRAPSLTATAPAAPRPAPVAPMLEDSRKPVISRSVRQLSTYEAEKKIRVIDEILEVVRRSSEVIVVRARE